MSTTTKDELTRQAKEWLKCEYGVNSILELNPKEKNRFHTEFGFLCHFINDLNLEEKKL